MLYKFSVGKIKLNVGATTYKTIIPNQSINIAYSLSTTKKLNESGQPIDEFTEEETITITVVYATDTFDVNLMKGNSYDLVMEVGGEGGGIAATLYNCKCIGCEIRTSQDEFSTTQLTFSKRGAIDGVTGEPTKQRVKFGSTYLGDSATVNPTYQGNVQSIVIPTALGILIRTTTDMGGGQLGITVSGYVKKTTRLELEAYLISLFTALSTAKGTLTIEYGLTSYTITNCAFVAGKPSAGTKNHTDFEIEFIKSAY
jgi:hypothetical protein